MKAPRLSRYTLKLDQIPVYTDGLWHTTANTYIDDLNDYQKIIFTCNFTSASMGNTTEIDTAALSGSDHFSINSYWDSTNLGVVQVWNDSGKLAISASAKTASFAFNYSVYGLK